MNSIEWAPWELQNTTDSVFYNGASRARSLLQDGPGHWLFPNYLLNPNSISILVEMTTAPNLSRKHAPVSVQRDDR